VPSLSSNSEDLGLDHFATALAARLAKFAKNGHDEDDPARWSDDRLAEQLMRQTLCGDEIDVAAICLILNQRKAPREVLAKASTRFLRDGLSAYRAIDAAVSEELALPSGADF
jgi:hypothetical protein